MAPKALPGYAPPVRKREHSLHRHELDGLLDGMTAEGRKKEGMYLDQVAGRRWNTSGIVPILLV